MGEKLIKPYEISVWEDRLTQIENSNPVEYKFTETRLATIGSNTMTGFNKIYNPVFNKKTNGEKTLTFSLRYKYFDPYSGNEDVTNPFAALLINERKVKLHYDNKWYEFIIKDHVESSDGLEWTYTCVDAFILELSKSGYNITFDSELNNNQGTDYELAEKTLENTDWQVERGNPLKQFVAEPIYKAQLVGNANIINASETSEAIPVATTDIYVFYNYVKGQNGKYVQFIIRDEINKEYSIDDNNVINATNFRIVEDLTFEDNKFKNANGTDIIVLDSIETRFQANRLVYNQLTTYDSITGHVVDRFKVDNTDTEVYKYTENVYTTSNVVMNYIANGDNFNALEDGTLQGWNPYTDQEPDTTQEPDEETGVYPPKKVNKLELVTKPELGTDKELANIDTLAQIEGFLKIRFNGAIAEDQEKIYNTVYNSGLENYASSIESIAAGQKFVFRWRAGVGDFNSLTPSQSLGLLVAQYTQDTPTRYGYYYKHINPEDVIMRFEPSQSNQPKELNNIVTGGSLVEQQVEINGVLEGTGNYSYVIDGVAQALSTKYVYVDDDIEYVWVGKTQTDEPIEGAKGGFIPKNESNYLPYYYITAVAQKSIPNSVFSDPTQKIGIFIYGINDVGVTESKTITKTLETLPLTASEKLSVKDNTPITVSYTAQSGNVYDFSFTAGVTNTESENCQYNAKTDIVTIKTKNGIADYTINYTDIAPIYIQDIELMRFVPDAADEHGETPVLMGNVPTATTISTDYYYIKPEKGTAAEDIQTYISLDELKRQTGIGQNITPIYNEHSEKNLSISISQSNCFNILQTIAETFECWVDLVVDHDERGYITYDEETGKPNKYVYLREYAGKDNWAGFKYGINLNTIERTVNSDEIVSKLIVDSSQSDLVDEGYVSITNAPSNQSGESYILNFDYYYNQGLLNREEAEEDRLNFISKVASYNQQINEQEQKRRDLEAALVAVGSKRNVYTELVESAQDTRTKTLEEFEELTGLNYEQYVEKHKQLIGELLITDEFTVVGDIDDPNEFVLSKIPKEDTLITVVFNVNGQQRWSTQFRNELKKVLVPFTDGSATTFAFDGEQTIQFIGIGTAGTAVVSYEGEQDEQLTEEDTILDVLGTLYTSSAVINNYSGLLTNANTEYWNIRRELRGLEDYTIKYWTAKDINLQRHVIIEVSDFIAGVKFRLGDSTEEETSVSKRRFDIESDATEITFTAPDGYSLDPARNVYTISEEQIATTIKLVNNATDEGGVEDLIENLQKQKDEAVKAFNNKYSRYIQEGTWNSTDYIDSELYYLDALQVSNTSAQPTVSYTISVVEISELEGFEDYIFDTGDKTYIEDTDFFGWHIDNIGTEENPNIVYTPAREEVIVSEVEWHLDEPDQNIITIQNYKTRFEDLFQRISAAVQTVQYNEATYAKISSLMDADGTINQNVLAESLNRMKGKEVALTSDGSIQIHGDEIVIHNNLTNNNNYVILNSEGIKVSADGGQTWKTAISGEGIDVGAVFTGTLNTKNVIIGNSENPSFRWDKSGISAFRSTGYTTEIGDETVEAYDLQTFVRYDQYGLYGIKDNGTFKANSLEDVKDKAHFAVTWDGFFIKNSYPGGGRVEITSENDFRVLNQVNGQEQEKIKIGALEWGKVEGVPITDPSDPNATTTPTLYGIRIKNDDGEEVMKTDDEGNITITGTIIANAGNIGGMSVDDDRMTMKHIVFEPETGIYSTYPYLPNAPEASTVLKPFIISDVDGSATFNNVIVRGSIKTSVFEYEEIQAVGGAFLFRPSSSIRNAIVDGNNIVFTTEKIGLFKVGDYLKISNFSSETVEDEVTPDELNGFGLTYVYPVGAVNGRQVTLTGAAEILTELGISREDLIGGSLIDMGRHATDTINGNTIDVPGNNNYGIGINSSDGFINLPPRAISLFETIIHPNSDPKVSYRYRGILGTLPNLNENPLSVNTSIYNNMAGTQGIYTDNMYLGDANQYLTFYTDKTTGEKKLKIKASQVVYEVYDKDTGQPTGEWNDVNDIEADGPLNVVIESNIGNFILRTDTTITLTCTVYQGNNDITSQVTSFTWTKKNQDGSIDANWIPTLASVDGRSILVNASDIQAKAIFICEVEF